MATDAPGPGQRAQRGSSATASPPPSPTAGYTGFATIALSGEVSPHLVTRHSANPNVAITLGTYAHLLPGMHSKAMNAIGNLIFGPPAATNVTSDLT